MKRMISLAIICALLAPAGSVLAKSPAPSQYYVLDMSRMLFIPGAPIQIGPIPFLAKKGDDDPPPSGTR